MARIEQGEGGYHEIKELSNRELAVIENALDSYERALEELEEDDNDYVNSLIAVTMPALKGLKREMDSYQE